MVEFLAELEKSRRLLLEKVSSDIEGSVKVDQFLRFFLICLFSLALLASRSDADVVVDQQCLPEYWGEYSIALGAPMGQEFVPSLTMLSFVELWIINNPSSQDDTARVFVVIHPDSIQGTELARSSDVAIPKPFSDAVRFDFSPPVMLEPGRTYLIEARRSAGPGNPTLLWGDQIGSCPGVAGVWLGQRFPGGGDFWHRTGLEITPSRSASWGELKRRFGSWPE